MSTRYLYASLNQRSGSEVPVVSNAGSYTWQTLTDDDGQWDRGWVANQRDRGIFSPWEPTYDDLLLPGSGAFLLGFLYTAERTPTPAGTILQIGHVDGAGALRGLQVLQEVDRNLIFEFHDDTPRAPQVVRKHMNDPGDPGEHLALFCYLDNRGDRIGSNSLMLFRFEPGSILMKQQGQPVDVGDGYAAFSGGPLDSRKQLRIGFAMDAAGDATDFLSKGFRFRSMAVFNFGEQAPAGLHKLMENLSLYWLAPTQRALELAGVTAPARLLTIDAAGRYRSGADSSGDNEP